MTAAALLAALALGIPASPAPPQDCAYIVPMIAAQEGSVMAGNLRTTDGGCIVWANIAYAPSLRRKDGCQLAAHEAGHLAHVSHSLNPNDLMYSPFRALRRSFCSNP